MRSARVRKALPRLDRRRARSPSPAGVAVTAALLAFTASVRAPVSMVASNSLCSAAPRLDR